MVPVVCNSSMCYWLKMCFCMDSPDGNYQVIIISYCTLYAIQHSTDEIKHANANFVWLVPCIYQLSWAEAPTDGERSWLSSLLPLLLPAPWGPPHHWVHFSANSLVWEPARHLLEVMLAAAILSAIQLWHVPSIAGKYCRVLMWGLSPQRICLLQTARIMNDACRTSQSVYHMPWNLCVCLHVSYIRAPSVAPSVFCWAYNKCQLIKIPTTFCCNLSSMYVPEIWHCALHVWILTSYETMRCPGLFSPGIDPSESFKIPKSPQLGLAD